MLRRTVVLLLTGVLMGACGTGSEGPTATTRDMLFLQTASGVSIVEPGVDDAVYEGTGAQPSADWSTVIETTQVQKEGAPRTTRIDAVDPKTGRVMWERAVPGRMKVKVVSNDGNLVALAPRNERHYLSGRRTTQLLILDARTDVTRPVTVRQDLEPEAFSTDGRSLFVLVYTPWNAPRNYQVRRLDLATEKLMEVFTPDAHLQERMRGTARIQAMSPDGTRLYTLYTTGFGKNAHSFIHTLALDELWAHCITLPHEFRKSHELNTGIAVSPDGDRLYVANSQANSIAEIDTQALSVTRTGTLEFGDGWPTHVLSAPSGLYLSSGANFTSVDPKTLTERYGWNTGQRVTGLQSGAGGDKVYIGLRRRVDVIESAEGHSIATIDPPGVSRISLMGRGSRTLTDYQTLKCAC